jgi:serine/threonine-protein kinase
MLTGTRPFRGETPMAVIVAHVQQPPPRPRSVNPKLPEELDAVVARGLQKDPARRWQSADELLEALSSVSAKADAA